MSTASDGPAQEPVAEPVAQTGRPPVPRPAPTDAAPERADGCGRHRTEQVPFPLPPLPAPDPAARPAPVAGPVTGQLDLGDYPPRVPGAAGRRAAGVGPASEDDSEDDDGAARAR